jgi:transcriptional regulator with XRE-family HTH domain
MKYFSSNMKYLRESNNLKQAEIQDRLTIERTSWSNYERGKSFPNLELFHKISKYFDISESDLLNTDLQNVQERKKEDVKKVDENVQERVQERVQENATNKQKGDKPPPVVNLMPKVVTVDSRGEENMVLVPVKAAAGYLNGYGDQAFIQTLPAYRLPGYNNGTFRMFEVKGASMHPTLNDGDIIIGKWVETLDNIRNDRIHVVITRADGIVVKRVLNRIQTDNKLILKSDNVEHKYNYPNIILEPSDVLELWYAVAFISHVMKSPSEMYTRIIDLEGRLTLLEHNAKK